MTRDDYSPIACRLGIAAQCARSGNYVSAGIYLGIAMAYTDTPLAERLWEAERDAVYASQRASVPTRRERRAP